jgi:hypothetical protein
MRALAGEENIESLGGTGKLGRASEAEPFGTIQSRRFRWAAIFRRRKTSRGGTIGS